MGTPAIGRMSRHVGLYVFLIGMVVITIAPIEVVVSMSLKTNTELALNPLGLPQQWLFSNYAKAWTEAAVGQYAVNSVTVALPTLLIVSTASSLAGYAFAVMRFRGRNTLFAVFLIGLMMPAVSVVTALSFLEQGLGLYNTLQGLIAAESALAIPLATFILRSSFRDLPTELREAVFIDGGTELTAFLRVMLPLAKPALTATAVLTFVSVWNDYLLPLVLINTESLRTIPLGLAFLRTAYVSNVVLIAASTTMAAIPSIAIYTLLQRQFIQGVAQGAVK